MDRRKLLGSLVKDEKRFKSSAQQALAPYGPQKGYFTERELCGVLNDMAKLFQLPNDMKSQMAADFTGAGNVSMAESLNLYHGWIYFLHETFDTRQAVSKRANFVGQFEVTEERLRELYVFKKRLGSGSFGEVWLVADRFTGAGRVCKQVYISKDDHFRKENKKNLTPMLVFQKEVNALKALDHPHVLKVYDVMRNAACSTAWLITEWCEGDTLGSRVKQLYAESMLLKESYVARVIFQILRALAYVKDYGFVHKDLKPDNIMYVGNNSDSDVKIIDFGLVETMERCRMSASGTLMFMAPEVLSKKYNHTCDTWAVGCIMYHMLTGRFAFSGPTKDIKQNILNHPYDLRNLDHVSSHARHLLKLLLDKDGVTRPGAAVAMRHPWFKHMGLTGLPLPELTPLVRENLLGIAEMSQFKILLMNLMAHHLSANDKSVHQLHILFSAVNRDFKGEISRTEFYEWLTAGGVADEVATRVFNGLDIRAGGRLSLTEFLAGTFEFARDHLTGLKGAFNRMDFNNDNGINLDGFKLLLSGGWEAGGRLRQYFCRLSGTEDGLMRWSDLQSYLTGKEGIFR